MCCSARFRRSSRMRLVVVQRSRRDLYDFLRERLEGVPGVEVILDSRARDRRMRAAILDAERREGDRRQPLSWRDRELWTGLGFRLVRGDPPRDG